MAETIDSFNFNSLGLENSWDVSPFSNNERARIIHMGFFFPTVKVNGTFRLVESRLGFNLKMYSNLEFFNKLKRYAEENLGLKDVIIGEPKTFISNRSKPEGWVAVFNTKAGLNETRDGFKTLI